MFFQVVAICFACVLPFSVASADPPSILLVDDTARATVHVEWTDRSGEKHRLEGVRPYSSDAARTELGGNLEAFVAMGGSRLEKGAGHPRGAIVRVGFYKQDPAKPMFPRIDPDRDIVVRLLGVRFNQPVDPIPSSVVQHLKYAKEDLEACAMPGDAREQFNLASEKDTLNGRIRPGTDARLGALANTADASGSVETRRREKTTVDLITRFKYGALRNLRDPWQLDLPGTFLEPIHFHIELEVLPEGVEPLQPATTVAAPD